MIPYFFMEVECIGNTQIIHMEETGITQRTIGLLTFREFSTFIMAEKQLSRTSWWPSKALDFQRGEELQKY